MYIETADYKCCIFFKQAFNKDKGAHMPLEQGILGA